MSVGEDRAHIADQASTAAGWAYRAGDYVKASRLLGLAREADPARAPLWAERAALVHAAAPEQAAKVAGPAARACPCGGSGWPWPGSPPRSAPASWAGSGTFMRRGGTCARPSAPGASGWPPQPPAGGPGRRPGAPAWAWMMTCWTHRAM